MAFKFILLSLLTISRLHYQPRLSYNQSYSFMYQNSYFWYTKIVKCNVTGFFMMGASFMKELKANEK